MKPRIIGYFATGLTTGLILIFNFLISLPDGKLHIVFCNVGQGDAAYVRFPDGRDMLVDGGPNNSILGCLGKYMPFWDRRLDIVVLTHPEDDHLQGLIPVFERFGVGYFIHSNVANDSQGYAKLMALVQAKSTQQRTVVTGERMSVSETYLTVLWPSTEQIDSVLGWSSVPEHLNDDSVVFWLRYGTFDALFTGDADTRTQPHFVESALADSTVELLKVPHHGSKTGMSHAFVDWLKPQLSVISVGRNSYGHPAPEMLTLLANIGSRLLRTDQEQDIEIVSDGRQWQVR